MHHADHILRLDVDVALELSVGLVPVMTFNTGISRGKPGSIA